MPSSASATLSGSVEPAFSIARTSMSNCVTLLMAMKPKSCVARHLHACRGGLTVMLLPLLVSSLAPLGPSTMGVTAVAVLAIPTTAVIELDARTIVQRSVYRLVGCAFGALMGLFCLYWVGSNFLVWLLLLMAGVWLSSQIQSGTTGIGYVGTQAGLAFLLSMI